MDILTTGGQAGGATALADSVVLDPLPFLARAGEVLAGSLDLEQTLCRLLDLVVPALADMCAVHLLDDDGRFRLTAARHYCGAASDTCRSFGDAYLDAGGSSGALHRLLEDGRSFMSSPAGEAEIEQIVGSERCRQLVEELGVTSAMVVPLAARGRTLGVMALATAVQPIFRVAHQHLAEELARRAALAIDSANLYRAVSESRRAAERARQRSAFLAEASATLAASLEVRTTLRTVVRLAVPPMADSCSVVLLDEDGQAHRVAAAHVDPAKQRLIDAQSPIIPIQAHPLHPIALAIVTGRPSVDNDITDESLQQYASGQYLAYMRTSAIKARLVVPLEARDRRIGVLVLSMADSGRTFDLDDVALGTELAGRAALAIDNARLYQDACVARDGLERSEERLRRALKAAGMVVWERDFVTGRTIRSDLAEEIFGRPNEELTDDSHSHLRLVHPDDRQRIATVINAAVSEGRGYDIEFRTLWPDNTVRWLSSRARVFSDAEGHPSGMSGTTHDVTARKQVELEVGRLLAERQAEAEKLRQLHRRLQRSLEALLGIHEVGKLLISVSDLDAVGRRLLEIAIKAARLRAAALRRRRRDGHARRWQQVGQGPELRSAWRVSSVAQARAETLATGRPTTAQVRLPGSGGAELTAWCVPLVVKGDVIGVLEAIGDARHADEPTSEILGSIALQAATALENARLYREVASSERALHRLVHQLMQVHEDERRRLAYEIHDGFAQMASGVQQLLEAYAHDFPAESEAAQHRMDLVIGLARRTVCEIRRVLAGLRPTVLDDFGLERGLRANADGLAGGDLEVQVESSLGPDRFPARVEIALFRLAQEALTNVRKHAGVEHATLRLTRSSHEIVLEVEDHGRGFDMTSLGQCDRPGERLGLLGMHERIAQVGGSIEIRSRRSEGTLVRAVVPVSAMSRRKGKLGAD